MTYTANIPGLPETCSIIHSVLIHDIKPVEYCLLQLTHLGNDWISGK